jgi:hypothetical protein
MTVFFTGRSLTLVNSASASVGLGACGFLASAATSASQAPLCAFHAFTCGSVQGPRAKSGPARFSHLALPRAVPLLVAARAALDGLLAALCRWRVRERARRHAGRARHANLRTPGTAERPGAARSCRRLPVCERWLEVQLSVRSRPHRSTVALIAASSKSLLVPSVVSAARVALRPHGVYLFKDAAASALKSASPSTRSKSSVFCGRRSLSAGHVHRG